MPRGDRTGPWGEGPMTGRRMGYCVGNRAPGYANPGPGYGRGFGRGGGRGYGRGEGRGYGRGGGRGYGRGFGWGYDTERGDYPPPEYYPPVAYSGPPTDVELSKEDESAMLENDIKSIEVEAKYLEDAKARISKRLKELKK